MPMPLITIVAGLANIVLGVAFYLIASDEGHHAPTALIPAGVGILFVLLGALAMKESIRKHVMHAAAALALILALSTFLMGATKIVQHAMGTLPATTAVRPLAWWEQIFMSLILVTFEAFCVRSFIAARKARTI